MPTDTPSMADIVSRCFFELVRMSMERVEAERAEGLKPTGPGLFTRKEAADYLAIGASTLDLLRKAGKIRTVMVLGRTKYTRRDLDRYIEQLRKDN